MVGGTERNRNPLVAKLSRFAALSDEEIGVLEVLCDNQERFSVFDRPLAMVLATASDRRAPQRMWLSCSACLRRKPARGDSDDRKKLADIAAETGLRITTLRSQLSAILKKVGADRQANLVRILTSVPVVSTASSRAE
jgi:hypothetical protein